MILLPATSSPPRHRTLQHQKTMKVATQFGNISRRTNLGKLVINQKVANDCNSVHSIPCPSITGVGLSICENRISLSSIHWFDNTTFLAFHAFTTNIPIILIVSFRKRNIIVEPWWVVDRSDRPQQITKCLRLAFPITPPCKGLWYNQSVQTLQPDKLHFTRRLLREPQQCGDRLKSVFLFNLDITPNFSAFRLMPKFGLITTAAIFATNSRYLKIKYPNLQLLNAPSLYKNTHGNSAKQPSRTSICKSSTFKILYPSVHRPAMMLFSLLTGTEPQISWSPRPSLASNSIWTITRARCIQEAKVHYQLWPCKPTALTSTSTRSAQVATSPVSSGTNRFTCPSSPSPQYWIVSIPISFRMAVPQL